MEEGDAVTTPLVYDTKGNLTQDQAGQVYNWDVENRLALAAVGAATSGYRYDALGRRLAKTASGLVTTFVHDGAQVVDEYEAPALASSTINAPTVPGYFSDNAAGTVTLASGGTNIAGTGDQFRYAYTMLTGDGSITTRITSQTNTNVAAKAGVMIRESLTWNCKHAALLMTPTNGVEFQQRSATSAQRRYL